jgi:hypothetical protein
LVWGSFATAKASPEDVDLLLILDEDFEMQCMYSALQAVCDSVRHYESDVFWARASHRLDLRKRGIVELELR